MNQPKCLIGDGYGYEVLYGAARMTVGVLGLTCEIGLREGGGTEVMVEGCLSVGQKRPHIAIDPYGGIPYRVEDKEHQQYRYGNAMQRQALANVYAWVASRGIDFYFFAMEDIEFFARFGDGVPIYSDGVKHIVNDYAFVYFDGPKETKLVLDEVNFFLLRAPKRAVWVFDDTESYDHKSVHDAVINLGFRSVQAGHKWVYQKNGNSN